MAKDRATSAEAIETLLEERQRIEQWLDRLSMAADKTPGPVRERVESDYRQRLTEVVEQLHGYRDELVSALDRHRKVRGGLARQEADASERLAEAELRHAVGEFDEGQWAEMKTDILESLVKIREELKSVDGEVRELEEVMSLVGTSSTPSVSELDLVLSGTDLDEPEPAPTLEDIPDPPPLVEPEPVEKRPARRAVDELEFLRSVTEDEELGPRASRASGSMQTPVDAMTPDKSDRSSTSSVSDVGADDVTSFAAPQTQPKRSTAKTLKCGECGTMNLPTEWYCERCGAELAVL